MCPGNGMERATLARDEIAVWRLPSDHPFPLETVLARYTGVDAGSLSLELTAQGKPVLPGSRLRFSLAHSGEVALVAVARDRDVGVDVERVRPDADRWALVDHALTARERHELKLTAPTERAHAFLSMWARKEALLKAAGVGLAIEPALIELDGDSLVAVPPELGAPENWTVITVPLPGYAAAVAVRSEMANLQYRSEDVVEPDDLTHQLTVSTATAVIETSRADANPAVSFDSQSVSIEPAPVKVVAAESVKGSRGEPTAKVSMSVA
jgi:4'-phosphopantetheinyl transferase